MAILVTGIAGFIGSHVAKTLLERGEEVIGIDNISDYYDVNLKKNRLKSLKHFKNLKFKNVDISEINSLKSIFLKNKITKICHLAAQAGVRYSLKAPMEYVKSNIVGHVNILECCKNFNVNNLVYASSSSVYGGNLKVPFSVDDRVDNPVSIYAATKRTDELISYTYQHLYGINTIGLRFFTVYGPWGRPDMATWIFTEKIINNKPIEVYNNGKMERDFTYIDDIVKGTISVVDFCGSKFSKTGKIYNIGNNKPENLLDFITIIEDYLGKKATKVFKPIQPGDVTKTYADISKIKDDFNFSPITTIKEGIPKFIDWYKDYHKI